MITANELRIKNKLQKDNGEIFTVLRIDNTNDVLVEEQRGLLTLNHNLFGIPITPSILEKCGFIDYAKNGFGLRLYLNQSDELFYGMQDCELRYQTRASGFTRDFKIQHLHQLQNLYFALTGQELEVNL